MQVEVESRPVAAAQPGLTKIWIGSVGLVLRQGWPLAVATLLILVTRWLTAPTFIETREGIFYVRGVIRYSVVEMRPYWPGYPVYMWVGKLFNVVLTDPVQAMHALAVGASTLCLWPIVGLTREWSAALGNSPARCKLAGWTAGLLWAVVPLAWLSGSEIFGDPLALLLGLAMLWLSWRALAAIHPTRWLIPAAILGGLMLGVRLAYIPLLLVLAYATWRTRRYRINMGSRSRLLLPWLVAASLALSCTIWLGWQLALEGLRFFQVGSRQLEGHYNEWGNSALSDPNLLSRPLRLLETFVVYGIGGWWPNAPWFRLPATILVLGLASIGGWRIARHTVGKLALLWAGSYLICTLLNYDVDLARYSFPMVAITCILAGLGLPSQPQKALALLAATTLAVGFVVIPLALAHHTSPLLPPRVVEYVNANLDPAQSSLLITDDMTALTFFLQENGPQYQFVRAKPEEVESRVQELQAHGRQVYATWLPGHAPGGWVPQARLCRDQYLDARGPLEIWLYRYAPTSSPPAQALACY